MAASIQPPAPTADAAAGPLPLYRARRHAGHLQPDPAQELAAEKLQSLHNAIRNYEPASGSAGWRERLGLGRRKADPPQGLYIFGGVGRGKSMLMDLFFLAAPVAKKRRVHFHAFMLEVHDSLHRRRQAGEADGDPIPPLAREIGELRVAALLRRVPCLQHRRRDAAGPPVRSAVRSRHRHRRHVEPRARRSLCRRTAARSVPAIHRSAESAHGHPGTGWRRRLSIEATQGPLRLSSSARCAGFGGPRSSIRAHDGRRNCDSGDDDRARTPAHSAARRKRSRAHELRGTLRAASRRCRLSGDRAPLSHGRSSTTCRKCRQISETKRVDS